jgi:hypothetical protein
MSRTPVILILAGVLCGCSSRGKTGGPPPESEAQVAERIKLLIPEASSSPVADWQALSAAAAGGVPKVENMRNQSLSMVLMSLTGSAKHKETFEVETIEVGKVAAAIYQSKAKGYGTLLQPDFITECKCSVDAGKATGTVAFRAEGLYRGKVEFTARRAGGDWRVEEFRLPGYNVRVRRENDGKWKMSKP